MLCNQCQKREADIYLQYHVNQNKKEVYLCQPCYTELKNESLQESLFSSNGKKFTPEMLPQKKTVSISVPSNLQDTEAEEGVLKQYARNVTQLAKAGLVDPVIGREKEIEQVIEILNRRNKNNPVLIGEPGVGKTAIAEGLAQRIADGDVPSKLQNREVYSLDVASLISGTSYRGQFEERMQKMISELQSKKNVILFIDEIHQIVGAGKTEGSMDAGNILKPSLARGELQVLGATTLKEYREIEKDAALERRLQPIMVKEPSVEDTIKILKGLRSKYESFHQVHYPDDVLEVFATLAYRYIQGRFLPDKAIDLLDEAGSKVNLRSESIDEKAIRQRLKDIVKDKQAAAEKEDYERASRLRQEETKLEEKLERIEQEMENAESRKEVTIEDIQVIIEMKTGIPVRKLQAVEQEKLKSLADSLRQKVVGQEEAVNMVAKAVRRNRAGFRKHDRPIASFLFTGPTGVGKTELARTLAEEIFGDRDSLVRLDMSEYMEKHTVSKLIGSPPGYIGYDEAGQLTEKIRRNPYSIVLLDEMEKAHPDVQNMFLQVLEDGRLTDSHGHTVSFKDTIIIMTSNAKFVQNHFRPEFLNRLDAVITFTSLSHEHLIKIVELMLEEVKEQMKVKGIQLDVSQTAIEKLAQLGYDPDYGARPLRRVIQDQVEDRIVDVVLESGQVSKIKVDVSEDQITVVDTKKKSGKNNAA